MKNIPDIANLLWCKGFQALINSLDAKCVECQNCQLLILYKKKKKLYKSTTTKINIVQSHKFHPSQEKQQKCVDQFSSPRCSQYKHQSKWFITSLQQTHRMLDVCGGLHDKDLSAGKNQ